jgi:hypothetical protein
VDLDEVEMLAALDGRARSATSSRTLARLEGASREAVEQAALPILAELLAAGFLELRRDHPSSP